MNEITIFKCLSCEVEIPVDYSQIAEEEKGNVITYCGCNNPQHFTLEAIEKALKEINNDK